MNIKIENNKIIIEMSLEYLIESQLDRYYGFKIKDTERMMSWIMNNFLKEFRDEDFGFLSWKEYLNGFFDEAYANGESWLEAIITDKWEQ